MAISIVSTTVGATTSGLTVAIATPGSVAVGDVLVAVLASQESTQQAFAASGWTAAPAAGYGSTNVAGTRIETVLYRVVTDAAALAALPASTTFTKGGSSNRNAGMILCLRGVDTTAPVNAVGTWVSNSTTTASTVPALTTTKDGALVLMVANGNASAGTQMLPATASGFTAVGYYQAPAGTSDSDTTTSRTLVAVFQRTQATAGSSGTPTYAQANATPGKAAYLIAFAPKVTASITPTQGMTIWNGTAEVPAQLSVWDGTIEKPVTTTELADGSYDLAAVTAVEKFYVAHRGGSRSFPEMTAEAYRRSARIYGMQALEMSVHRTTDGVFVLSHDDKLLRETGTNISIAASTWSQLSGLTVLASTTDNSAQGNQPLARLDAVLPLWIGKRVIFLEDKTYNAANRTALLAYLQTFSGYQQHIVWKVDGNTTDNPITPAKAAGLKVWGYFFTGTDPALFPARAARFDYIGPDHAFTAAEWTAAEATGVPMVAHIIQTQAQLDTVNAHPIVGVMLANVRELFPRG